MKRARWDVAVVGSGPGGSIAAMTCAKAGLDTLLVEKKKLPRDKVCSGMVLGSWAKNLIKEHFGEIPKEALIQQGHYSGITLHVGAKNTVEIPNLIPVGWRKNLDYWMCQQALQAGVYVKDDAKALEIRQHAGGCEIALGGLKGSSKVYARYIIGADGAFSSVRKCMYPDLKVRYRPAYRECFDEQLAIDQDRFHWFFPYNSSSPRFDINYKEGFLLIEGGHIRLLKEKIRETLEPFGFRADAKPLWRDGCAIAALHEDFLKGWFVPEDNNRILQDYLMKGRFVPAKDHALLVGDAAGLILPFTHEGIGSALKSGFLAAESVTEALSGRGKVDELYLRKIQGMKTFIGELFLLQQEMDKIARSEVQALCESMAAFFDKSMNVE
ncbi:MAG: putative oxidoreductase [Syntrophorhabdus sp. PtaU1.Bin050]|nr:MAG: putative oxidoreductase [Syntrophorhabdus sp. PtaU1.Bin050]